MLAPVEDGLFGFRFWGQDRLASRIVNLFEINNGSRHFGRSAMICFLVGKLPNPVCLCYKLRFFAVRKCAKWSAWRLLQLQGLGFFNEAYCIRQSDELHPYITNILHDHANSSHWKVTELNVTTQLDDKEAKSNCVIYIAR